MRVSIIVLFLLSLIPIRAQHTISGTFSPAKEFSWLIAYHLTPGGQEYVADTAIKDGRFSLEIGSNKPSGIYRMVYAVPQDEFYFDVLYNGEEDIQLHFDSSEGVNFTVSKENIPYGTYFREIHEMESTLVGFYTNGNDDVREYNTIIQRLKSFQQTSEEQTKGLLAHAFISANRPYIPSVYETLPDFVANRKEHYFDAFKVTDTALQASGFLSDKIENYVFSALPLKKMTAAETEIAMQENVQTVTEELASTKDGFKFIVYKKLWSQASESGLNELADFIYSNYLKALSLKTGNAQTVLDIERHNRLRLGAIAPEMIWEENGSEQKLSGLNGAEHYLLVFWSSQCGHCLSELPALHKALKNVSNVKVLAIGLEDDDTTWSVESAKLPDFKHLISLGKWDSEYADLYDIHKTPTYYVLDTEKKIIAKPDGDSEVITFLNSNL
ncbi:redoxin domain-containing protein [Aggregatimonas sangjinii]|uniref:Redoxin domain-containing protein n=1 Tax=Aggregatimonas sangjinii TaxID=2583587 RepID=A0A5B7SW68_9FLAO|nr:thioredoxin-like domain-containing protein [Aggregatimonas sangjinii]QCX01433.1 redoxin domain-containing protein [Aggregatimonas sangjinii]